TDAVQLGGSRPEEPRSMILLGVDPHKSTRTATAVQAATNQPIDSIRIDAALGDYRRLPRWATTAGCWVGRGGGRSGVVRLRTPVTWAGTWLRAAGPR
ncbi:hypothetical protein, partial [Actinomadura sp. 9N215]|uniref:hypothetical protein n=1 Tax=Actinomadura sp. 9N215 TaxID=3375150 RepID=UPI00379518F0